MKKDDCDCCFVCADAAPPPPPSDKVRRSLSPPPSDKVLGESCGGPGGRYGECKEGLMCHEAPSVDLEISGTCLVRLHIGSSCSHTENPEAPPQSACSEGLTCLDMSDPDASVVELGTCVRRFINW